MPCPFHSNAGFTTDLNRQEYLEIIEREAKNDDEKSNNELDEIPKSLEADMDISKPLYFWQLHSIIGKEPIETYVTAFYDRVFDDEEAPWFRDAFAGFSEKEFHIKANSSYWIDSFGGGRIYWGGKSRLDFHHTSDHASPIMNEKGAKRWMFHMKQAIQEYDFSKFDDPRILPCIVEFLRTQVMTYAEEFNWQFDESDFDVADFDYQNREQEAKA